MKIVEQHPEIPDSDKNCLLSRKRTLYFDIETTGLNARRSHLYLLGAMWKENEHIILRQWFAEKPSDEETILREFMKLTENFDSLVHFNGATFDLPYLCNKALYYEIDNTHLKNMPATDLYQQYRLLKPLLPADDMKLSSLQRLCGYSRKDHHTGKELIKVYENFLQTGDPETQNILEQHNYDDIAGMVWIEQLSPLLSRTQGQLAPLKTEVVTTEPDTLNFLCTYEQKIVPDTLTVTSETITLTLTENTCSLQVPMLTGEYYYYYKDYKNYYYLPAEDRAIHKSIAIYTDPSARKKATAENCYERKTGTFIPAFSPVLSPAFQTKPKSPDKYYFLVNDYLLNEPDSLATYCTHLIRYLLSHTR